MERKRRAGRTVVLRLRFGDYTRATRSCTLPVATGDPAPLAAAARDLLGAAMPLVERRGVTLVGITVTNLDGPPVGEQLALFEPAGNPGLRAAAASVASEPTRHPQAGATPAGVRSPSRDTARDS
jgi:DNA polymerase-4